MTHQTSIRRRTAARAATLALVALAGLAGCDDPNLFRTDIPPELEEFSANAASYVEGDTILFTVNATGARAVTRIRVELSGAMTGDTAFLVDEPATTISGTLKLPIPNGTGPSPELTATAWAIDVVPDTSGPMTTTVQITDATPPTVSVTSAGATVDVGLPLAVTLNARDNRGLTEVGASIMDSLGTVNTVSLDIDPSTPTATPTLQLPTAGLQLGMALVVPFARDINGFETNGDTLRITLRDADGPTFVSVETNPDSTVSHGDSVQVEVELADPAGIRSVTFVGLAYRGDPTMGTDSVVERFAAKTITFPRPTEGDTLPRRYTLNPYLQATGDVAAEPVEILITATDGHGNVSDTMKAMFVGGPAVAITYPPAGFEVGSGAEFDVRISIADGTSIDSARLIISGDANQRIPLPLPARTDTPFVIVQSVTMPSTEGTVYFQARAWNKSRIAGQSRQVAVIVNADFVTDDDPPVVSVAAERLGPSNSGNRMELTDSIRIRVSAFDANSGLGRIGVTALVARGIGQVDTLTVEEERIFSGSRSLEELVFVLSIDSLYDRLGVSTNQAVRDSMFPDDLDLWVHGFAADMEGNVACAVGSDEQRSCSPEGYSADRFYTAADSAGLPLQITTVRGSTVLLGNRGAIIGDIAIDTVEERVFLSNKSQNLVEVLQLNSDVFRNRFENSVQVGSEPLGLFMGERVVSASEPGAGIPATPGTIAPTLLVANSGGTNISMVHMDPDVSNVQEVDVVRLRTTNAVLFEIEESEDQNGSINLLASYLDLADRPHFLAQDSLLRIVYSTIPTGAAELTTLRFIHADPDPTSATDQPEVRFLLTADMVDPNSETTVSLANVDSIHIAPSQVGSDAIRIFAHEPGYPDRIIASGFQTDIGVAVESVRAQMQSVMDARGVGEQAAMFFPFYMRGSWDTAELAWSDTTFVSASGDRGTIAIGEGAKAPLGRIMLWFGSQQPQLSDEVEISDLVNNASEEVLGIGLNQNGSLGVARGRDYTYFFTPDLRLQGIFANSSSGGAGATFHPEHNSVDDGGHTDPTGHGAAFTGTSENSIEVVNTNHFDEINTIVIRDNIVGQLRSGPPLDSDNNGQGGQCIALALTEEARKDCIVAKLYGVTSAGGVVVVNVRRRDLEPYANP